MKDISVIECLGEGWEYYKKHIWITLAVIIFFYVVIIGVSLLALAIPFINFLFGIFVSPALGGGLYYLFLNVGRGAAPRFEDIFFGFQRYGTLVGLTLLMWGVMIVGMIPSIIFAWPLVAASSNYSTAGPDPAALGMVFLIFANIIVLIFALYRYWLVYFVIVDEPRLGLFNALRRSSQITKGNGHNLILLSLASFAIMILLTLMLLIPVIIFGPMLGVAMVRFYLKAKEMHDEPAVTAPEGPVVVS